MKEKLIVLQKAGKSLIENVKQKQTRAIMILATLVFVVIATGASAYYLVSKNSSQAQMIDESESSVSEFDSIVAIVGGMDGAIGSTTSNNSWSGEIISLSNLAVQPDREGTISEWYVHIGERVNTGQVIGKLSRPPQMPDAIMALSEKSQMLSEARTNVEALRAYSIKRIAQLKQLRIDTENSNKQKIELLGSNTQASDDTLLSSISAKKKMAQVVLRGSITKTFSMMYGLPNIPQNTNNFSQLPKSMFGTLDTNLRNAFTGILINTLTDLKNPNIVPEKNGSLYFDSAIKLANTSISDSDTLTEADLASIKTMLVEDQLEFVTILGEIKSMQLESANIGRESIDKLAEIDAMIADLEKELAMAEGDLSAREEAYRSVSWSITGGYSIVSPNSGVVSSIMKKPGEFVGPGMPVATVTSEGNGSELVRMKIPNDIQKPKTGEILSVVRPGFKTDVQKARLVGVGSSLDDGSYMADAVFVEESKWSVGASVRVLAPVSSSAITIKYSSIFWSKDGVPTIWAVSEADRIFAKQITIGRTLGSFVEVYTGLQNGDRYIIDPTLDIKEGMFLSDLVKEIAPNENSSGTPAKSGKDKEMGGMPM